MPKPFPAMLLLLALSILPAACGDDAPPARPAAGDQAAAAIVGGPFDEAEFRKFLKALPSIPGLTVQGQTAPTGDVLSARVKAAIRAAGWTEERFTYIYGHAVSMLTLDQVDRTARQMRRQLDGLPPEQQQMMGQVMGDEMEKQRRAIQTEVDKMVPGAEQTVILAHMEELRSALGMPAE